MGGRDHGADLKHPKEVAAIIEAQAANVGLRSNQGPGGKPMALRVDRAGLAALPRRGLRPGTRPSNTAPPRSWSMTSPATKAARLEEGIARGWLLARVGSNHVGRQGDPWDTRNA